MEMYLVGGIVRDMILGLKPKDHDFSVVLDEEDLISYETDAFSIMRERLLERGVEIFVETPEFLTIRGRFAKDDAEYPGIAGDFVLARKDSTVKKCKGCNGSGKANFNKSYSNEFLKNCGACDGSGSVTASDGRRPDFVEPGTLLDDLARRDFTVNAMAMEGNVGSVGSRIIDPFDGRSDLEDMILKFVGDPMTRIREDALRVMRAYRFCVTKGFKIDHASREAIISREVPELLTNISEERRADELSKMFRYDTEASLMLLSKIPEDLRRAMFSGRVRLDSSLKASKVKYV